MTEISMNYGDTKTLQFTLSGLVEDLSLGDLDFSAKTKLSDAEAVITKTTADFDLQSATVAWLTLALADYDSLVNIGNRLYFALRYTDSSGVSTDVLTGSLVIALSAN